ncbi:MAG: PASTA domain-containing protein [Jatrophihabitans sp.]|uniref:PASTA domain-containing protein n=1 Tax=Jatrophihabitans sp. TaxID=1932789 RepID=UPI003F814224
MADDDDQDRDAWRRLDRWFDDDAVSGEALRALTDVGRARRLLDQAELHAVRQARRDGASWAEIATRLGVSRQAAWERWRDLDVPASGTGQAAAGEAARGSAVDRVVRGLIRRAAGSAVVPDLVGLSYADAFDILLAAGLAPTPADKDQPPIEPAERGAFRVVRQYPDSGTKVPAGSVVRLWLERGGGEAGVREPRRPTPPSRETAGEPDLGVVVGE